MFIFEIGRKGTNFILITILFFSVFSFFILILFFKREYFNEKRMLYQLNSYLCKVCTNRFVSPMIEQFNFDLSLIFAILNGKVSAAINRKLHRNFRQSNLDITPEQWTVLLFLWKKDGVSQQELCNATFKDKPSMTRLIDNMERENLVVRIASKKDRRTNLIHLTRFGREIEEKALHVANKTMEEALIGLGLDELNISQEVLKKVFLNTKD